MKMYVSKCCKVQDPDIRGSVVIYLSSLRKDSIILKIMDVFNYYSLKPFKIREGQTYPCRVRRLSNTPSTTITEEYQVVVGTSF